MNDGKADAVFAAVVVNAASPDVRHIREKLAVSDLGAGFAIIALIHDAGAVSCAVAIKKAGFDKWAALSHCSIVEDRSSVEVGFIRDKAAVGDSRIGDAVIGVIVYCSAVAAFIINKGAVSDFGI